MPRGPRLDAPGIHQHVLLRGIERRPIFHDDRDREDFLDRLARQLDGGGSCLAWALMPNHVHMVLRTGALPLSRLMARLATGYAVRFNLRHERSGHLFQNRFKSILIGSDAQLKLTVRYVHRNPLEARLVTSMRDLARYPWSGHATLMGHADRQFQQVDEVLGWFGSTPRSARHALVEWMHAEDDTEGLPPEARPADASRSARRSRAARGDPRDLDDAISFVCRRLGADETAVRAGRRDTASSYARAAIAHLAVFELGLRASRVARSLGVSAAAIGSALRRGKVIRVTGLGLGPSTPRGID